MKTIVAIVDGKVEGYLTPAEFAELHGVTEVNVRVWIHRKLIEPLRIGNANYIKAGTPKPECKRGRPTGQRKAIPKDIEAEWIDNGNETISCSNCHTWFSKEREPYLEYCGYCGRKMKHLRSSRLRD